MGFHRGLGLFPIGSRSASIGRQPRSRADRTYPRRRTMRANQDGFFYNLIIDDLHGA